MAEFLTRIVARDFNGRLKPCVNGWHLYLDLGHDGEPAGDVYYFSMSAARKIVRVSDSPHRRALLNHLDVIEREFTTRR